MDESINISIGVYEESGSYITSVNRDLALIDYLVDERKRRLEWSLNERWCMIDGRCFNVSKVVYDAHKAGCRILKYNERSGYHCAVPL